MGEVLVEVVYCINLVVNIDVLDQYGYVFGVFLLSNEQDNLVVCEVYKKGFDVIEKFGFDCNVVMNRYGLDGNVVVLFVVFVGSIFKKNWMISNVSVYIDIKVKFKVMEKIFFVYVVICVCGFKVNFEVIN